MSERSDTIGVFLAFTKEDGPVGVLQKLGPAIQNTAHAIEIWNPSVAVPPPLFVVSWVVIFQDLIEHEPILVGVVECADKLSHRLVQRAPRHAPGALYDRIGGSKRAA